MHDQNIDFNNKTFVLVHNTKAGEVSPKTVFKYYQTADIVTADYIGGNIRGGKILARLEGSQLYMLYQCITLENDLKAGKAIARITKDSNNKLRLKLDWEWLEPPGENGTSEYMEI